MTRWWRAALLGGVLAVTATACGGGGKELKPASLPAGVPAGAQVATVVAVVDAGTIQVTMGAARATAMLPPAVAVSVIGVAPAGAGTCRAAEADAFARRELPVGATVYVLADAQDADAAGALLRYVWESDGGPYNEKLVHEGLATAAAGGPNQRYREQLAAAESEARTAGRGVWGCPPPTTTTAVRGATTTAPRPSTTKAPPTTAPATTVTTGPGRAVALGSTFTVSVGDTVSVAGEGLTVTFTKVVEDSRCRPTQQCILAGDASIAVAVVKTGTPAAVLVLGTAPPKSARYASYTVELVQLTFGQAATLKVS